MGEYSPTACIRSINGGIYSNYNMLFCVSNIEIMIMAYINTFLVIYLTVLHFKSGLRSHTWGKLMCKVKTSILLIFIAYHLILAWRYTISN